MKLTKVGLLFGLCVVTGSMVAMNNQLVDEARKGNIGKVRKALDAGANIEKKKYAGYTPLIASSARGHADIVEELLSRGANVAARSDGKQTALHWAARRGHEHVVRMLLNAGADVDVLDKWGQTPLSYAAPENYWLEEWRHERLIRLLLTHGADSDKVHNRAKRRLIDKQARILHKAATKIQALWRGHRVRKKLGKQKTKS